VSRRRDETDDDFDEDDDPPPRRRSAGGDKPGGVKTIGVLLLIGGITAIVQTMGLAGVALGTVGICCGVFCFWPGFYLAVVWGVLAIVRGSGIVGGRDGGSGPPFVLLSLQVALILNLDVLNLILGVVGLVLANGSDIKDYYAGTYESSDD